MEAGDDVTFLFDGWGVETLAAISDSSNKLYGLGQAVKDNIRGACSFCAISHKVESQIRDAGWKLLADYKGEASFRQLLVEGYEIFNI